MLRAGFTDVLSTGMLIRWISVKAKPIAMPANPAGERFSVEPKMTNRNMNVSTNSASIAASMP